MRVFHKGLILVGIPFVLSITVMGALLSLIWQNDRERLEESRMRQLAEHSSRAMLLIYDAGYSLEQSFMKHDWKLKERFRQDIRELRSEQSRLMEIDPTVRTSKAMQEIDRLINNTVAALRDILSTFHGHLSLDTIGAIGEFQSNFAKQAYGLAQSCQHWNWETLTKLQQAPERNKQDFALQSRILLASVLASVITGILLARWYMNEIGLRLKLIMDNTIRLGRGEALNQPVPGWDEIASVDKAFHDMAAALSRARSTERALFENASDLICIFDDEYKITAMNPACERILQLPPGELIGLGLAKFVHEADLEKTVAVLNHIRTGTPSAKVENRVKTKNGDLVHLLWSVYWSELDNALYAVAHDITEQKELDAAKAEFLAMVSHDLRSPLTSIFGAFKLLAANAFGELPQKAKEQSSTAITSIQRLLELINDLLDIEKLEAGELLLDLEETNIADLMRAAINEVQALADTRQIHFKTNCSDGDFPLDRDRILQVMLNLLSNAIKFSPNNSSVEITALITGSNFELSVKDEGRGIPEHLKETVFERFKQVALTDAKRGSGTGLGLPICRQIVGAHGGLIRVESKPDEGSTFFVSLPHDRSHAVVSLTGALEAKFAKPQESQEIHQPLAPVAMNKRIFNKSPFDNLRLVHKGLVLVAVPVLFEIIFAGALFPVFKEAFEEKQKEVHNRLIATSASNLLLSHYCMGTCMSLEKSNQTWEAFKTGASEAAQTESALLKLTESDPAAHALVERLMKIIEPGHAFIRRAESIIAARGINSESVGLAFLNRDTLEEMDFRGTLVVKKLIDLSNAANAQSPAKLASLRTEQIQLLSCGLLISVLIGAVSTALFGSSITRRLQVIEDNAGRFSRSQPLKYPCTGSDEVGQLDHVFHSMAEALNESRRKETAVFDNAQDVFCSLQEDSSILRINPACNRIFGRSQQELTGDHIMDLIDQSDRAKFSETLKRTSSCGATQYVETAIVPTNDSARYVLWSLSWSADERSIIGIAHDITPRIELGRLKHEFLAMVSHDLRTPLTSVQSVAQMLSLGVFGDLPEKARDQMSAVQRNSDRLLGLINDLLDLEKLQSGHMPLETTRVEIGSILTQSVEALQTFAHERNIKLIIDESAQDYVIADSDRIVQVCVNLISNAIKFSPAGAEVTIEAIPDEDFIEFRIVDRGRGVPHEHQETIFAKYKQVAVSDGKRSHGTGLGLPICQQIISQHGGTIGVTSTEGQGSTFWFKLPRRQEISVAMQSD